MSPTEVTALVRNHPGSIGVSGMIGSGVWDLHDEHPQLVVLVDPSDVLSWDHDLLILSQVFITGEIAARIAATYPSFDPQELRRLAPGEAIHLPGTRTSQSVVI